MSGRFASESTSNLSLSRLAPDNCLFVWRAGPRDHCCDDCQRLDGEVRPLEEWLNTVTPGSSNLACRGRRCSCRLEATLQPVTRRAVQTLVTGAPAVRAYFGACAARRPVPEPPQAVPPSHAFPQSLPSPRASSRRQWGGW